MLNSISVPNLVILSQLILFKDKKMHFQSFKDIWFWTQDLNHLSVVIRRLCLPCEIGLYALSMFLTHHCSSALAAEDNCINPSKFPL